MDITNLFKQRCWCIIDQDKLLNFNINKNSNHKQEIIKFSKFNDISLKGEISFEMSLELASKGYISFHGNPDSYLLIFMPDIISDEQVNVLNSINEAIISFDKPKGIIKVAKDMSYSMYDNVEWKISDEYRISCSKQKVK